MYVSLSSYSMHHCMISPFLSPQPVAEVCRCVVHALLYMVVSLFSEDSLGDLKVRRYIMNQRGGLVYTITNLQMTLTPTWLSCYTFGEVTFNSLSKGDGY